MIGIVIEMSDSMIKMLIGILVAIILTVIGNVLRKKRRSLMSSGLRTEGVIFDVTKVPNGDIHFNLDDSDIDPSRHLYTPVIRFVTADDQWITKSYIASREYGYYEEGATVKVIYDPKDPENFILDDWSSKIDWGTIIMAVGVLILIAISLMVVLTIKPK